MSAEVMPTLCNITNFEFHVQFRLRSGGLLWLAIIESGSRDPGFILAMVLVLCSLAPLFAISLSQPIKKTNHQNGDATLAK